MCTVLKNTNVDKKVSISLDTPNICVTHTHTPRKSIKSAEKRRAADAVRRFYGKKTLFLPADKANGGNLGVFSIIREAIWVGSELFSTQWKVPAGFQLTFLPFFTVASERQLRRSLFHTVASERHHRHSLFYTVASERHHRQELFYTVASERQLRHSLFYAVASERHLHHSLFAPVASERQLEYKKITI